MKFITERELRDLYKAEPFTTYVLEPQTRITPEARQFLVDRGIRIIPGQDDKKIGQTQAGKWMRADTGQMGRARQESWSILRLRRQMECLESLFLMIGANLLHNGYAVLAEEVFALGKYFSEVKKSERDQTLPVKFPFGPEAEKDIVRINPGNYFDITEFHVRTEKGIAIASLNHLQTSLRQVESSILEAYWNDEMKTCTREDLLEKITLLNNQLLIMMWKSLGGQKCEK